MTNDENLQQDAERGLKRNDPDSLAYEKIFAALSKEPIHTLPSNFADRIVLMVQKKTRLRHSRLEIALFSVGAIFCLITLIVSIALTGFSIQFGFLKSIGEYKWLMIFAIVSITVLQAVDKFILRRKLTD